MKRKNFLILVATASTAFLLCVAASGQSPAPVVQAVSPGYLNPGNLHGEIADYLRAYGQRLSVPGQERTILVGSYSDGKTSLPATFTFQWPSQVRFDLAGSSPKTLIFNGAVSTAAAGSPDLDLLETLSDDTAESFFRGLAAGVPTQWLGGRFRTEDISTSAPYTGPLRDIFRRASSVAVVPGVPLRMKFYLFDSRTKYFAGCRYEIQRAGITVKVEVISGAWTKVGAEAFPSSITRFENGKQVFSFSIKSAAAVAKTADATFTVR
jgi:hypothetical protein